MKYCKRCFRNIAEDVTVCPFCKQADKLIDYDKEKRGEDFTCNSEVASFSSHIDRSDAYNAEESDADNAYGNTKRHDIDNCENSAEAVEQADPGTPGENFSKSFNYLRSLPAAERQKLIKDMLEDIDRRYGSNPDEGTVVTVQGREITVSQFKRIVSFFARSDISNASAPTFDSAKAKIIAIVIWLIITVIAPPVGIFFAIVAISIYSKTKDDNK